MRFSVRRLVACLIRFCSTGHRASASSWHRRWESWCPSDSDQPVVVEKEQVGDDPQVDRAARVASEAFPVANSVQGALAFVSGANRSPADLKDATGPRRRRRDRGLWSAANVRTETEPRTLCVGTVGSPASLGPLGVAARGFAPGAEPQARCRSRRRHARETQSATLRDQQRRMHSEYGSSRRSTVLRTALPC